MPSETSVQAIAIAKDASDDKRSQRIGELIDSGHPRDVAVAIAYEEERREAKAAGGPPPNRMDFVKLSRKLARGRSHEYLEAALAEAKSKLPHRDFAVLHAVARARAGGLASARARTSTEKALLLGPSYLTEAELADALERAESSAAAESRLGVDNGGAYLAEMFWAEKARRAEVKKGEPTPSDVHVDKPLGEEQAKKAKDKKPDSLEQARLAAMEAQAREARDVSATIPSEPVVVQDIMPDGEILLTTMGEAGPVEMVAASADFDLEPGDIVEVSADMTGDLCIERPSAVVVPAKHEAVVKAATEAYERRRYETKVPFIGPADAPVVFVSGAPTELELARGEPLVGSDGAVFAEKYLTPMGLTKSEVAVGFACPVFPKIPVYELSAEHTAPWREWLQEELNRWPGATVVALGKAAADTLGDRALLWLPHPFSARSNEARYDTHIERKIRRIRKALDAGFAPVQHQDGRAGQLDISLVLTEQDGEAATAGPGRANVRVAKSADEKQIVYGLVLDPVHDRHPERVGATRRSRVDSPRVRQAIAGCRP